MAYTEPTAASVSQRLTGLLSKNNPLMRQARTQGAQSANRRGLMNSSIGVQAGQSAATAAALPIASQEAQQANQRIMQGSEQAHQKGMQDSALKLEERIAQMNVAAHEREKASSLAAAFENTYSQQIATIMNNADLPASVREQYLSHAAAVRDSNLSLVEQMYGINLDWSTPRGQGDTGSGTQNSPSSTPGRTLEDGAPTIANPSVGKRDGDYVYTGEWRWPDGMWLYDPDRHYERGNL